MNKLTKLKIINISLSVIALISIIFNLYFITKNKEPIKQENEIQTLNNNEIIVEEKKDNEVNIQEEIVSIEQEKEYIYKYIEGKEKQVMVEKEVEKTVEVPTTSTDATVTYTDASGNSKSMKVPSGAIINFSAGEHGTYDSVPAPITLTDNQELDITDSSYNPSKVEVNYIFKGFSYSGNTMTCMYSLASNTVNVECKQVENIIRKNDVIYTQLEYLESTGTQYIDTNIEISENILKQNLSIEVECAFTDCTISANQATGKNQNNFFFFGANTSHVFYSGIGQTYTNSTKSYDTNFHKHKLEVVDNKGKYLVDGVEVTDYGTLAYITPEYVGNFHLGNVWSPAGGNVYISKCKFKRCTCYYKNALSKDLVPVERIGDGVLGMFDLVDGSFLTSAGTGLFERPNIVCIPGINAGKVFASGSYESGSSLTLTAIPNDGYMFVKWSDGITSVTRNISVGNNTVYTALFVPNN